VQNRTTEALEAASRDPRAGIWKEVCLGCEYALPTRQRLCQGNTQTSRRQLHSDPLSQVLSAIREDNVSVGALEVDFKGLMKIPAYNRCATSKQSSAGINSICQG
jgi:hypothetical protein